MSSNPFLRRIIGEADEADIETPEASPLTGEDAPTTPVAELVDMWRNGQKMDVATQLMFTPASYVDLVDISFILGQEAGRELGRLLDELADSENVPVPSPSADYSSVLQRVAANREAATLEPLA